MESLDDVLLTSEDKMSKCMDHLRAEFSTLRTGKASPSLVENVRVPYYGTPTRLREIAGISTPEPRLIVINPYDPGVSHAIEKAIVAANIGITPIAQGKVIRIPIPELSGERREEMTRLAKRMAEEARVAIRGVRRDANEEIKALQKEGKVTEDERDAALKDVQKTTDEYVVKTDELLAAKEKEILEV